MGSLLHAVDRTTTPAGARLLRRWLLAPLLDPAEIGRRHDALGELVDRPALREAARAGLTGILDIERLLARTVGGTATPRDLAAIRGSLERLPDLLGGLALARAPLLVETLAEIDPCAELLATLRRGLVEAPPLSVRDGGVIRDGFSAELDEYREIQHDGRAYIAGLEARERETTGIASLKVRFNRGVRLLDRGLEGQPAARARALRAPSDDRRRRALRHAGAQGAREQGAARAGAHAPASSSSCSPRCAPRSSLGRRRSSAAARATRADRRAGGLAELAATPGLPPAQRARGSRAAHRRRTSSGRRAGWRATDGSCRTTRRSTPRAERSPCSPGPTWAASRPTCARSR